MRAHVVVAAVLALTACKHPFETVPAKADAGDVDAPADRRPSSVFLTGLDPFTPSARSRVPYAGPARDSHMEWDAGTHSFTPQRAAQHLVCASLAESPDTQVNEYELRVQHGSFERRLGYGSGVVAGCATLDLQAGIAVEIVVLTASATTFIAGPATWLTIDEIRNAGEWSDAHGLQGGAPLAGHSIPFALPVHGQLPHVASQVGSYLACAALSTGTTRRLYAQVEGGAPHTLASSPVETQRLHGCGVVQTTEVGQDIDLRGEATQPTDGESDTIATWGVIQHLAAAEWTVQARGTADGTADGNRPLVWASELDTHDLFDRTTFGIGSREAGEALVCAGMRIAMEFVALSVVGSNGTSLELARGTDLVRGCAVIGLERGETFHLVLRPLVVQMVTYSADASAVLTINKIH